MARLSLFPADGLASASCEADGDVSNVCAKDVVGADEMTGAAEEGVGAVGGGMDVLPALVGARGAVLSAEMGMSSSGSSQRDL